MLTSPASSSLASAAAASTNTTHELQSNRMQLKSEDFIKMMITQLQNQDPTDPVKNQDLLAQMSQIGQLESSTELQTSLKSMVLQNNLGAAGNLIGKMVNGLDDKGDPVKGLVSSVRVVDGNVGLELDNGKTLGLDRVTSISVLAPTKAK